MGLDITAYSRVSLRADLEGQEEPEGAYDTLTHLTVMMDQYFPGRAAPITEGWYEFAEEFGFRAGSYSGYNRWRDQLAKMAGYPAVASRETPSFYANGAWEAGVGPFWELICFADNEGTIGSIAAVTLLKEFEAWDERAKAFGGAEEPWFYESYQNWTKAFALAADGGAVSFH